jgi:hypothetical protein
MKYLFLTVLLINHARAFSLADSISGKLEATPGCSNKAMVWLSLDKENYKERLLLMHTEVPQGGSFKFFVKAGKYQIRASDEAGCEYAQKVSVSSRNVNLAIKRVKK